MAFPPFIPPVLRDLQALRTLAVWQVLVQALLTGGIAGGVIGIFRLSYTHINAFLVADLQGRDLSDPLTAAGIGVALLLLAGLGWLLLRHEPLISGSGIPQVELTVAGHLPMRWFSVLWAKFAGTLVSLSAGLSVGREGPCIQMGAAVGCGVGRLWHRQAATMPRFLVGGSVAGLTAAFGAPVAGLCFAFEEMKSVLSAPMLLFTAVAAAAAWFVVQVLFDLGLVFPFAQHTGLSLNQSWIPLVLGLLMGMLGALYNVLLIGLTSLADRCSFLPRFCRILLPFAVSGLLLSIYPQVLVGFGPDVPALAHCLTQSHVWPLTALLLLLTVKIAFSCLSFASGVAGGLLMPMLFIGAQAGACAGSALLHMGLMGPEHAAAILTLCMAGLFAATVRTPLTGAALLLEMTGAWHQSPAVLVTAFVAVYTANALHSVPVYDSLKRRILQQLAAQNAPAAPKPPAG